MLRLLKFEMSYFRKEITIIILLPIIFSLFAMNDLILFSNIYFLKKYFWSVLVGMGIYGLVFIIWSLRKKEFRERQHSLLPVSINNFSTMRWIFGVLPFVLVGFYIELHHGTIPNKQLVFIDRINGQLGMMFIALVGVDFIINSWFALESKRYDKRIVYSLITAISLMILTIFVIYSVSTSLIKPLGFGGEEILFFIWGILISIIDAIIFTKRKSFLG